MKSWPLRLAIVCWGIAVSTAALAADQENAKPAVKSSAAGVEAHPLVLKIFRLQNMRAESALKIVGKLLQPNELAGGESVRFAVDEAGNSLIASGKPETLRTVEALIMRLDVRSGSGVSEPQTRIFEFRYVDPHEVQNAVRQLGLTGLTTFPHSPTKALIVNGRRDAIDRVDKLVRFLDAPPPESRAADASIRVVWLVDKSLATDETPPLPSDLVDAVAGLRKKMGIGELRLATQMTANIASTGDSHFDLSGTAVQKFHLEMIGTLTRNGAESRLNVDFSATRGDRNGQRPMCSLNTTCSGLVPGRPVIVGMTTVNSQPSVLVIELLPK
jgi:type II/III secretion system protein